MGDEINNKQDDCWIFWDKGKMGCNVVNILKPNKHRKKQVHKKMTVQSWGRGQNGLQNTYYTF